jgi:L-ribulose-5-phosphate 3-epimerase UlaE
MHIRNGHLIKLLILLNCYGERKNNNNIKINLKRKNNKKSIKNNMLILQNLKDQSVVNNILRVKKLSNILLNKQFHFYGNNFPDNQEMIGIKEEVNLELLECSQKISAI